MKEMRPGWTCIRILVLSAFASMQNRVLTRDPVPRLDDRDAIQTSLLNALKRDEWRDLDEHIPSRIVLRPQFMSTKRQRYSELLKQEIDRCYDDVGSNMGGEVSSNHWPNNIDDLNLLLALQDKNTGPDWFLPPSVRAIRSVAWDKHILVTDRWPGGRHADSSLEGVVVLATVDVPSYSRDGDTCFINMSQPFGLADMKATMTYILTRTNRGWKIVYESTYRPL